MSSNYHGKMLWNLWCISCLQSTSRTGRKLFCMSACFGNSVSLVTPNICINVMSFIFRPGSHVSYASLIFGRYLTDPYRVLNIEKPSPEYWSGTEALEHQPLWTGKASSKSDPIMCLNNILQWLYITTLMQRITQCDSPCLKFEECLSLGIFAYLTLQEYCATKL